MEMRTARELADELLMEDLAERRARANKVVLVAELAEHYILPDGAEANHGVMVDALCEEVYPFGGPEAPNISEFTALEIAALLRISKAKAAVMIEGAVHLKWQLPALFDKVRRLLIDADRAVQASYAVAHLPRELAQVAIQRWSLTQERYSWTGAFKKLDELIAEVEPFRAEDEAMALEQRKAKVSVGGKAADFSALGYVEATVDVINAKLFDAALSQIAELLKKVQGDESALDVRRAKAFGVLSRPAYALALIQQGAQNFPQDKLPVEPLGDDGLPLHGPAERYLPAGCAGHVCGTIDVPLDRLLPKVSLDVVIEADAVGSTGIARIDDAVHITVDTLGEVLDGKSVRLQPVIDLPRMPAEDQYRPSVAMRRAVLTRWRAECFPFSNSRSIRKDLDHILAWFKKRGPGQTNLDNLVPLPRKLHRAKTAGLWMLFMDEYGRAIWTSPLGFRYVVTPYGTEPLLSLSRYGRDYERARRSRAGAPAA